MKANLVPLTEEGALQYYVKISNALARPEFLNAVEQKFLEERQADIVRHKLTIWKKQLDWLYGILAKHSELADRDKGVPSLGHDYFIRQSWAINKPKRRK